MTALKLPKNILESILADLAATSLRSFIEQSWSIIDPEPFTPGWHIDCIAEHLEAVTRHEIRNLIINVPPRHGKSMMACVFWPCWAWVKQPQLRWLFTSYGQNLVERDGNKCLELLESTWYQSRWGNKVQIKRTQKAKANFANMLGGYRLATTVGGRALGEGCDIVVVDDPHKVDETRSDKKREEVIRWWGEQIATRSNNPQKFRKVIIMQRLHELDLCGHLLSEQLGYEHLCLPAEYEPHRVVYFLADGALPKKLPKDPIIPTTLQRKKAEVQDPRQQPGELLWPQRFDAVSIERLKKEITAAGASPAGQLGQRPAPAEGSIFLSQFFQHFTEEKTPQGLFFNLGKNNAIQVRAEECRWFQCCDTAMQDHAESAFTVVGTFVATPPRYVDDQLVGGNELLVYDIVRQRLQVPFQFNFLLAQRKKYPQLVFQAIESKASGIGIIQQGRLHGIPFRELKADRSKEMRAASIATSYQNRLVYHKAGADWLADFEDELLSFPSGAYKDQVDVLAYAGILLGTDTILSMGIGGEGAFLPTDPYTDDEFTAQIGPYTVRFDD